MYIHWIAILPKEQGMIEMASMIYLTNPEVTAAMVSDAQLTGSSPVIHIFQGFRVKSI